MAAVQIAETSAFNSQAAPAGGAYLFPTGDIPSLFDTDSDDDSTDNEDSDIKNGISQVKHIPLNEVITAVPCNYSQLLEVLLPRLQPIQDIKGITVEDQQSFAQILIGELASQFSIIQYQIDDPFLTPSSNKELHRRIFVQVATVLESLFHSYIIKATEFSTESVLSPSAQMSCLRAELTIQANKRLNVPSIRREILAELRNTSISSQYHAQSRDNISSTVPCDFAQFDEINLKQPKLKLPPGYSQKIDSKGLLNITKRKDMRSSIASSQTSTVSKQDNSPSREEDNTSIQSNSADQKCQTHMIKKATSQPQLSTGEDLLHELGMKPVEGKSQKSVEEGKRKFLGLTRLFSVDAIEGIQLVKPEELDESTGFTIRMGEYTEEMLREDVESLAKIEPKIITQTHSMAAKTEDDSEEFSPLLAAHISGLSLKKRQRLKEIADKDEKTTQAKMDPLREVSWKAPSDEPPPLPSMLDIPQFSFESASLKSSAAGVPSDTVSNLNESQGFHSVTSSNTIMPSESMNETDYVFDKDVDEDSVIMEEKLQESQVKWPPHLQSSTPIPLSQETLANPSQTHHSFTQTQESQLTMLDRDPYQTKRNEPQPDTLTMILPNKDIVRASDIRVSDRSPLFSLRLQPYPTIYNELTGELDELTQEQLDDNLKEGQDIIEIYKELAQTFSKDHLSFEKDPALQPCLNHNVNMTSIHASSSLSHRKSRRVINQVLSHAGFPPWQNSSRREWLSGFSVDEAGKKTESQTRTSGSNREKGWNKWWRATVSTDDYLKFIASKGSDYLGVVYHMYDSSGSDSEDEQHEKDKKQRLKELNEQLLAKEKRRLELLQQKTSFTPGLWNINTVAIGGLGKDPEEATNEDIVAGEDPSVIQMRLEGVWQRLQVSQEERIAIAIQYSHPEFSFHIPKVLELWEQCCEAIEEREKVLKRLESFEEHASDPTRHFCKSPSSISRLREAKTRTSLHKEINKCDNQVIILAKALSKYGNILTYKGRNYLEKMSMDRTEILYFLHQKRRQTVLQPAIQLLNDS